MKTGILTFQRSVSYGAFFQALGLQSLLESLGHEVELIDYCPAHRRPKTSLRRGTRLFLYRSNLLRGQQLLKFRAATRALLRLSPRRYDSLQDLREQPPAYDAVVCGSDQIWNPGHTDGFDAAYFGGFGAAGLRRVAYAASLGAASIPEQHRAQFVRLAGAMDRVSLREASGQRLAQELLGRPCAQMPDPTLVWGDFSTFVDDALVRDGGHVMSFRLGGSALFAPAVAEARRVTGAPHVHIKDNADAPPDARLLVPTPGEWLGLVRAAQHVVTDSFHAVVFSILFHRPFTAIALAGANKDRAERITALLERFGLTELYVQDAAQIPAAVAAARRVDWARTDAIARDEAVRGRDFLREALA